MGASGSEGFVGVSQMWSQLSDLRVLLKEENKAMRKRSREVEKQT